MFGLWLIYPGYRNPDWKFQLGSKTNKQLKTKKMKVPILNPINVCAFLGLIMAFTIVFKANAAEAKVLQQVEWVSMNQSQNPDSVQEEILIEVDFSEMAQMPTITVINKYGEVIAAFYGEKSEIQEKFKDTFKKCQFITASGKQEFYLMG